MLETLDLWEALDFPTGMSEVPSASPVFAFESFAVFAFKSFAVSAFLLRLVDGVISMAISSWAVELANGAAMNSAATVKAYMNAE